jgi:hypothetical protein
MYKAGLRTILIVDGFSCREQIAQLSNRRALRLAGVLKLAIESGYSTLAGSTPESRIFADENGACRDRVHFRAGRLPIIGRNIEAASEGLIPRSQAALQHPICLLGTHEVPAQWPAVPARRDKTSGPPPIADRLAIRE